MLIKYLQKHASRTSKKGTIVDIYGSQVDNILQSGLADIMGEEEFEVKSDSLSQLWDNLVPDFHEWLKK